MVAPKTKPIVTSQADVILTGVATMQQLGAIFRTDPKTLPKRLVGILPEARNQQGYSLYNIREAAGRIVEPSYEIEDYIKNMNPTQLPNLLGKEFWNAQIARIKFEEAMGILYPLQKVVEALSALFSTCRMRLLLMSDSVERQTSLTEAQRRIIKKEIDGTIDEMRAKIVEQFEGYGNGPGDDGTLFLNLDSLDSPEPILVAEADEEDDDGI